MLKKLVCAFLLFACAAVRTSAQQSHSDVAVIRAGKFIDVDAGRALSNQLIVIRNGKIEAVGENISIPSGATVIDLSKMTVLPGLIDCHTHLADGDHDANSDPTYQLKRTASQVVIAVGEMRVAID